MPWAIVEVVNAWRVLATVRIAGLLRLVSMAVQTASVLAFMLYPEFVRRSVAKGAVLSATVAQLFSSQLSTFVVPASVRVSKACAAFAVTCAVKTALTASEAYVAAPANFVAVS